jgi:hypothetical protein
LQAFKEQILGLQLIKEVCIYDEHGVVEDVPECGANDEELAAMLVRPRAGKKGINASWDGLKRRIFYHMQFGRRGAVNLAYF